MSLSEIGTIALLNFFVWWTTFKDDGLPPLLKQAFPTGSKESAYSFWNISVKDNFFYFPVEKQITSA